MAFIALVLILLGIGVYFTTDALAGIALAVLGTLIAAVAVLRNR